MTSSTITIMDFELTAWEGSLQRLWQGPGEEPEIVQIGAVKLADIQDLREIDSLDLLVKPTINPELSDYFTDLTGITQGQIAARGVDFNHALDRLIGFMGDDIGAIYFFGIDDKILEHNCQLNSRPQPFDQSRFINARQLLVEIDEAAFSMVSSSQLPEVLGFEPPGEAHQGIDDCRCIAQAFRVLRERGDF